MATDGTSTNSEFELRGFNHLALVARDMAETIAWYEDILGMKLVKTLELPGAEANTSSSTWATASTGSRSSTSRTRLKACAASRCRTSSVSLPSAR
jgi:hypothetical protein